MEKQKFQHLLKGIEKKEEERYPRNEQDFFYHKGRINYGMACELAMIIQNLTSASRDDREYAKKKVRELVKIGQENEE